MRSLVVSAALLLAHPGWTQPEPREQADPLEAQLAEAVGLGRIDLLLDLAEANTRDDPERAVAYGMEAMQLARAADDRPRLAAALNLIGVAHRYEGAYERALEILAEAELLCEKLGDLACLGDALIEAGIVYRRMGDYEDALVYYLRANQAYQEGGVRSGLARVLTDIGLVKRYLGHFDEALTYYHKGLALHEELGNEGRVATVLNNIGVLYRRMGEPAQALDYLFRSLAIKQKIGDRRGVATRFKNIGSVYRDLGELDRAMDYYRRAISIQEEVRDALGLAESYQVIAVVERQRGRHQAALATLNKALGIATEINARDTIPGIYESRSATYEEMGRYRDALAAFQQYEAGQSEFFKEKNGRAVAEMQARFEAGQKEKEIQLLRQQQALQALDLERQRDTRRALAVGFSLVVLIVLLVFNRFRLKSRETLMAETVRQERALSTRLQEIDQLKDEFLANTSHELRTPLYGITGLAESLADGARGELPETARSDLAMIVASGRRLGALVGDVLDLSKLRRRSLDLRRRPVDLRALAEVVLALSRALTGSKALALINAVAPDLPPADADEDRLQQILLNLVGNAVKLTESGSVEVAAEVEDGRIVVRVSDTGIGIAEDQLERIFEAFEQADASTARAFGGTGLGLAVTRQLVELHGGRIWVDSTPRRGSTFHFTLPVSVGEVRSPEEAEAVVPPALLPAVLEAEREGPAIPEPPGGLAANGSASLLIVDDEPVNRQVLANHLSVKDFSLAQASGGPEALRLLTEQTFDLVLLDVMMPKMSGYEVCRALRKRFSLHELPVIFLTAKNRAGDRVAGLEAGGNDYLSKPIAKDELLARVNTHLDLLFVHQHLAGLIEERTTQIAERERLIGELRARNEELARINFTVSHDLRNPLTTIKNFVGVVRRDAARGDQERLEEDLGRIDAAAEQMRRLLEKLLELSRVGQVTGPPEEVALGELVREALGLLAGPIAERGVGVEIAADLPVVSGDRTKLLQMLRHLLGNAVKFLGDQPAPRIEVGVRRQRENEEAGAPAVYVSDNGIGIDSRYHDKVFGLFDRLDPKIDGTGVGLALVQRILEVHGGRVWVESEGSGCGSTFCFTLPRLGTRTEEPADNAH